MKSVFFFIGRVLKKCFCWFSYLTGALVLCGVLLVCCFYETPSDVPDKAVLYVDFDNPFYESHPTDFMSFMGYGEAPDMVETVDALRRAATDDRVVALYAKISFPSLTAAQIQDIRAAVADFRKSGKKTVAFSPSFGSIEGGLSAYYLAGAFDEIVLQPTGEAGLTGIGIESTYFKKTLEKIGVTPEFSARHEYKTGAAAFTDDKMSDAERENLTALANDMLDTIAADIAKERGLSDAAAKELVTGGPYFAEDALAKKLVDKLAYASEIEEDLTKDGAELMPFEDYLAETAPTFSKKESVIAYVPLTGVITDGESRFGTDAYTSLTGAQTVADTLDEIAGDETVKAVVLRLDSPGGGYTPSDAIRERIEHLKKTTNLPVVCSMGSTAASGAYFISLACDKVFAQPLTITGSVGVFGGKFVAAELLNKLGVTTEILPFGKNAGFFTPFRAMTPSQKEYFEQSLDRIYADFTGKTRDRRALTDEQTDKIARGRVFTGRQAAQNGLTDAVGGIAEARAAAAAAAGVDATLPMVFYPSAPSEVEMALSLFSGKAPLSFATAKIFMKARLMTTLPATDARLLYWR